MSSFKRRAPSTAQTPAGTRLSAHNSSVLHSTGLASIDDLLGGGLPLGSVLLVGEDSETSYARLLLKFNVAQCLATLDQHGFVAADDPSSLVEKLMARDGDGPAAKTADSDDEGQRAAADDKLKIAFRYEGLKKFQTSVGEPSTARPSSSSPGLDTYCSTFDISKTYSLSSTDRERLHLFDLASVHEDLCPYTSVLKSIESVIRQGGYE
jgi:elongator complex protein 4